MSVRNGEGASTGRGDRLWAVGLFAAGLLLRLVHVATIRESPFFVYPILDPRMYDTWGQAIAAGDGLGDRPFFQDPLYPYFLAAFYKTLGHGYTPVVLVQGFLGALIGPLLLFAARPWLGRVPAIAAGAIASLYLPSVYYEGMLLKTCLATFLVTVVLVLLSRALRGGGAARWAAVGLVLGLACLTRGNLVLVFPALAAWLVVDRGAVGPLRGRALWTAVIALSAGCLLVLGATGLRNRIVGGEWILTTSNAGQNFYIGNNALNETGRYTRLPFVDPNPKYEERDFAREARRRTGREMTVAETSRFWFGEARSWIADNPGAWLRLVWLKLRVYWSAFEIPDNLDYAMVRETAPVLRLPIPGFGLVAPLGLLGALLCWRRSGWPRALLIFLVVYSASVVLFFVFSRFRMPMMPALFVLAGFAAVELLRLWSRARDGGEALRRAAAVSALGLLLLAFVNLPVRGAADSLGVRLASTIGLPVRVETSAIGHFNLGVAYAARAKEAEDPAPLLALAESELRRSLEGESRYAQGWVELGKVLARQERNREAIDVYLRAAEVEPGLYRTHHALGLLYRRVGDLVLAVERFRLALRLEPRHAASAVRLGEVLMQQGEPAEAREAFRHALNVSPGNPAATEGLRVAESLLEGS
jgi:4-amino-4-deoxy-L-arabinose transferase-like glycosyltransferase